MITRCPEDALSHTFHYSTYIIKAEDALQTTVKVISSNTQRLQDLFQFHFLPPELQWFFASPEFTGKPFESSKVAESQVQDILWQQVRRGMAMVDKLHALPGDRNG